MKFFAGWAVAAGLVLAAASAQAQSQAPHQAGSSSYTAVSDFGDPYTAVPREPPPPRYGYGPTLLPPEEVYTVLRESGFLPLGIPRQRGFVYTIAVIDRGGDDGRLIIDARNGRILRFIPASRIGDRFDDDLTMNYGSAGPPPTHRVAGPPRPPASVPHVANRAVPLPKASPLAARPVPEPEQQAAAAPRKAVEAETLPPPTATVGQARPPAPTIQPSQEMPKVQGLE
ncbi:hypothetical protein [Bradyrhizobium sp.]|uniref:hypothetical protein n=1 Tax=Bradyrhizobium sp. TaxID=376 RepID=UPI003C7765DE